jgi:hypothetical protein
MRYRNPEQTSGAGHMADNHFEPGSMDVTEQEKTFEGFMRWVTNTVIVILLILVFLAIFAR